MTDHDAVNRPAHYTQYKGLEVIDLTEQMNFNRGNAVKYIARAGFKDPSAEVEDLEKARWYLAREIERVIATQQPVGILKVTGDAITLEESEGLKARFRATVDESGPIVLSPLDAPVLSQISFQFNGPRKRTWLDRLGDWWEGMLDGVRL